MLFQLVIPSGASVFTSEKQYLLSLETSLWFFALVVEYLCTEAETVTLFEAALLGYLLLYPTCLLGHLLLVLLVYLSTCYLFYLDLHVTLPQFEVPQTVCVVRTVIQCCPTSCECLPSTLLYLASRVYILQQTISSSHRTLNTLEGITIYNNIWYLICCEIMRPSVFSQCN